MFIRGARAVPFDISVGASHGHNTARNDCHDAVGAWLRIPAARSASQPAASSVRVGVLLEYTANAQRKTEQQEA